MTSEREGRMKKGPSQIEITASTRTEPGKSYPVFTSPDKPALEKPAQSAKKRQTLRFRSCFGENNDPVNLQRVRERKDISRKKRTRMWRFFGGIFQPVLGTANYLLGPTKPNYKPVSLPTGFSPVQPTSLKDLEAILHKLDSRKAEWANLSTLKRADILRRTLKCVIQVSKEAAEAATTAKGSYGGGIGEEWNAWLPVAWAIRELAYAMDASGQPAPNATYQRPDGQWVVDVFPLGVESLFFGGMKGEVWIQPGKLPSQGANYRAKAAGKKATGQVSLVLGAGNQTPVACMDILHKLLVDDAVVVCKMNPVNEYLGEYIRRAYAPLVESGYVEVVYGGTKEGAFLSNHDLVRSIHLTGSTATYDAVVWCGQKKTGEPPLKKEVGAELGCVTPYIITPGEWTEGDMEYYADEIVSGLVHNAGHNCTKAEILVTDKDWPQREALISAIRERLHKEPRRVAWYPGSEKRAHAFKQAVGGVEELGQELGSGQSTSAPPTYIPWLFKSGLSPEEAQTKTENWCGVLQEVALPGTYGDPEAFLEAAVRFANEDCWGTLSCALMVPPSVSTHHADAVDKAVAALRYGSVNINVVTMLGFCVPKLTWGAYPGSTPQDIGSGNCAVHNTLLLDFPEKSVLHAPWRYYPTHLWSPSNRNLEAVVPAAIYFLAYPNLLTLVAPALAALRG